MDKRSLGPLKAFELLRKAGDIKVAKAGDKWVAWAEPSADFSGMGDSPLAAMKALVERVTKVKKAHGSND